MYDGNSKNGGKLNVFLSKDQCRQDMINLITILFSTVYSDIPTTHINNCVVKLESWDLRPQLPGAPVYKYIPKIVSGRLELGVDAKVRQ